MFQKLTKIQERFNELSKSLSDSKTVQDQKLFRELSKEYADLKVMMEVYSQYQKIQSELEEAQKLLEEQDSEIKNLAKLEITDLTQRLHELELQLKSYLLPKDPLDDKNVLIEIRAGTGGEEAALFASDLFRMYSRYAEKKGWKFETMSSSLSQKNGFREVIVLIEGKSVYSDLKYESGVHRVQRVPETEAQGRIHTSTVTVAVLPEALEVEVKISPNDLKIDTFRSSGPGGQSVNKTDSAIRVTHIPTGLVVSCQDEKSQHKNKAKALKVLRARLLEKEQLERQKEMSQKRKSQIGTGDRSERIRTYNFPQNRLTDHRIGLTLKKLDIVMEGNIGEVIEALRAQDQAEQIKE